MGDGMGKSLFLTGCEWQVRLGGGFAHKGVCEERLWLGGEGASGVWVVI